MAGDWIKMRKGLHSHPKVVRMASALKADKYRTVGALHAAWCLFDEHSEDGTLPGYTFSVLDDYLDIPGFSKAMHSVGWLNETPQGIEMPEFDTHNGRSAKRRAQDTNRKKGLRESGQVSACKAEKKRTREEKRREEKSNKNIYTPEFDAVWSAYPARAGGNNKQNAFKAWNARLKSGADPAVIAAGVSRYASFCVATGKVGTEYVKQASTFFGPNEHYLEPWEIPGNVSPLPGHTKSGRKYGDF